MPAKKSSAKKSGAKKQTAARKTGAKKTAQPAAQQQAVPGTILRGADGNLYFVPDSALAPFRVFDVQKSRVEKLLAEQGSEGESGVQPQSNLETLHTTIQPSPQPPESGLVGLIIIPFLAGTES